MDTDRERKRSCTHPQENTPEGWGISLRGSTAVVRETAQSCLWIQIFIHGTVILLQRHSPHVSSLKRKHVSRLSMHTVFLDRWMRHIFKRIYRKHVWSFKSISFHCILTTEKVSIETWRVRGRFQSYYSSAMWEIPPEPSSLNYGSVSQRQKDWNKCTG